MSSILFSSDEVLRNMSATEFVVKLNEEAREEMKARPGLWIGELVEDAAHWAGYRCFTGEDVAAYLGACADREKEKESWYD